MDLTVFLGWRHLDRWFPVGRLDARPIDSTTRYSFRYVLGSVEAERIAGFQPLPAFPEDNLVYVSDGALFPTFLNRTMNLRRADRAEFLRLLGFEPGDVVEPLTELARSGGIRQTDSFDMFPCPEVLDGQVCARTFLRPASRSCIDGARPGDVLTVQRDGGDIFVYREGRFAGALPSWVASMIVMGPGIQLGAVTVTVVHSNKGKPFRDLGTYVEVRCPYTGSAPCAGSTFFPITTDGLPPRDVTPPAGHPILRDLPSNKLLDAKG